MSNIYNSAKTVLFLTRYLHNVSVNLSKSVRFCHHDAAVSVKESSVRENSKDLASLRRVCRTKKDYLEQKRLKVVQPESPRLLRVSIIGEPNAGKSTLLNQLLKWKVSSVSKKVHTTKENTLGVLVDGNTQICFLDTPGLITPKHGKKHHLENSLIIDPENSLLQTDLIAVIVDTTVACYDKKLNTILLTLLSKNENKPSILILNKVDLFKRKRYLFELTNSLTEGIVDNKCISYVKEPKQKKSAMLETLFQNTERKVKIANAVVEESMTANKKEIDVSDRSGWSKFSRVFMVSALSGDGIDSIRNYLIKSAKPVPWIYHNSVVTDQSPEKIVIMIVREKLLDSFPKEIPYNLDLKLEMLEESDDGVLKIVINVVCFRKGNVKILIGPSGKTISRIVEAARQELCNTFRCDVLLNLAITEKGQ